MAVDEYELIKVKRVIRSDECPRVKFSRWEGSFHIGVYTHIMKTLKTRPVVGQWNEFAHANKKYDCEIESLKMCGMKEVKRSFREQFYW